MTKKNYNYQQTKFITSAPNIYHLPNDYGIEIAFVGRSNTGKSSALNALTKKKLAYTSKIPGRTQFINLFEVTDGIKLVDLPGYGYTQIPESIIHQWKEALNEYLQKRKCLKGLIIFMDIRHPLKNMDIRMINWSISMNIPILVLLTKADKLAPKEQKAQVTAVSNKLEVLISDIQVEIFSSFKKIGINKLQLKLDNWFNEHYTK